MTDLLLCLCQIQILPRKFSVKTQQLKLSGLLTARQTCSQLKTSSVLKISVKTEQANPYNEVKYKVKAFGKLLFNISFSSFSRLKGITCGLTTEPPRRKRSRSVPIPKIVTSKVENSANNQDGKKDNLGTDLPTSEAQ